MWREIQRVRQACDVIITHGGKWVEFVYSKPNFKKSPFKRFFFGLVVKTVVKVNIYIYIYIFFFFFKLCHMACGIFVP